MNLSTPLPAMSGASSAWQVRIRKAKPIRGLGFMFIACGATYQFGSKLQGSIHFFSCELTFQSLKSNIINFCLGQHVLQSRIIGVVNVLVGYICKNGRFRIFYAKLYILLSVDGSTNRRNVIILGGDYNLQVR